VDLVAAVAQADVANADAVVGAQDAGIAQRGGRSGRAREVTTRELVHRNDSFL
jgi:hypothetical protein